MCNQINYPSGVSVDLGNELTPTQVKDEPQQVEWPVESGAYYTLCMTGKYSIGMRLCNNLLLYNHEMYTFKTPMLRLEPNQRIGKYSIG